MRYALWTLITLLFAASLCGMSISALLWSRRIRDAILELWVRLGDQAERQDLVERALALYQTFIAVFLLTPEGQVSKRKTRWLSAVSVTPIWIVVLLTADDPVLVRISFGGFIALFSIPFHWWLEYRFSKAFLRGFSASAQRTLVRRVLHGFALGALSLVKVLSMLALLLIPTMVALFARQHLLFGHWLRNDPEASLDSVDIDEIPYLEQAVWTTAPLALNSVSAIAIFGLGEDRFHFQHALLLLLSLSTSGTVVLLLVIALGLTHSRRVLRTTARICEFIAARDPRVVFAVATTLFALSTGLMQAFTFFPMPTR